MHGPVRPGFDTSFPRIQEATCQLPHQTLPPDTDSSNAAQMQGSFSTTSGSGIPIAEDPSQIRLSTLQDPNHAVQGSQRSTPPPTNGSQLHMPLQPTAPVTPARPDEYNITSTGHESRTRSETATRSAGRNANTHEDNSYTEAAERHHHPYDDMIIESKNVDTSALGIDPMLWLDYMPHDLLDAFGPASHTAATPGQPPD